MGTVVNVLTPAGHPIAPGVVEEVFRGWETSLTRFSPESELSRLNGRPGEEVPVSDLLFQVVETALLAARATRGVFDPTMLRQIEDLGYDRTFSEVARSPRPSRPAPSPGGAWRRVKLDREQGTVRLPVGAGIDLGGIAKGMAVDAALRRLDEMGVEVAAVNAGGDLAVLGVAPGLDGWPVAVETPEGPWVVTLREGALATSSTSHRRWWQGGVVRHHLIDPRTGLPATGEVLSASVAAPTCAEAEVAAKTALILGVASGSAFLSRAGLRGLLVLDGGRRMLAGPWTEES